VVTGPAPDEIELHRYTWTLEPGEPAALLGNQVQLPPRLRAQLDAFGAASAPYECCGIGIGPAGEVHEFHPLANVHEQPRTRYEIAAADQLRIYKRADDLDWQITLVFHSHPATEPFPSTTDLDLAGWPDAVYAILGCATTPPTLRAYRIVERVVTELAVN
jgi:[CysO sulfur-carrier protein]-S-L-cysteine hydrolase